MYLGRLTTVPDAADKPYWQSYVIFIVRDTRRADVLFQCSDNTWQAYNRWPANESLYTDPRGAHARDVSVSFDRPYGRQSQYTGVVNDPLSVGSGAWLTFEFPLAYWLEQQGCDVSYCSNSDLIAPDRGLKCKAFLSVGHDEYWDIRHFRSVETMRDKGVSLLLMSGHAVCWVSPSRHGAPSAQLAVALQSEVGAETARSLRQNRYDPATGTLVFSPGEVATYRSQLVEWSNYFGGENAAPGLPPRYIKNKEELNALGAYFAWAAWATVANRPGKDYSYTNNWPYEPLVGNTPTTGTYVWSALSLVTLLGGLGVILLVFGKFDYLGWKGRSGESHAHEPPSRAPALTPSQMAMAKFFAVVGILFLLQTLVGGGIAHSRVESGGFYGIDISRYLPSPDEFAQPMLRRTDRGEQGRQDVFRVGHEDSGKTGPGRRVGS